MQGGDAPVSACADRPGCGWQNRRLRRHADKPIVQWHPGPVAGSEDCDDCVLQLCCSSIVWLTFPAAIERQIAVGVPAADTYASKTRYLSAILCLESEGSTASETCQVGCDSTVLRSQVHRLPCHCTCSSQLRCVQIFPAMAPGLPTAVRCTI